MANAKPAAAPSLSPRKAGNPSKLGSASAKAQRVVPLVNPVVDHGLTVAFVSCVVWFVWNLYKMEDFNSLAWFGAFLIVCAIAIRVVKYIFYHFGRSLAPYLVHLNNPLSNKLVMHKWLDQSWQLAIHVSMTLVELYVLRDETWWQDTRTVWIPLPSQYTPKLSLKLLYLSQMAIWTYTAFSHRFLEKRRKDYVVMYSHHVFTIFLVGGSYIYGSTRAGMLILYIHDISDIFVDVVKMLNFLRLQDRAGLYLSEIAFAINIVAWAYYRLYLYPTKLLYTAIVECHELTSAPEHRGNYWVEPEHTPLWQSANVVLLLLYCLHVYWFYLFMRILKSSLVSKKDWHESGAQEYEGSSCDDEAAEHQD